MFLSIIVPVYNTEMYLNECLDSLIAQNINHEDYEIICINDGSTDNSLAILKDYKARYNNVVIIDQDNKGVSSVRNAGLKAANGEYIWFIDSDDFIQYNVLNELKNAIIYSSCDRLLFKDIYLFNEKLSDAQKKQMEKGMLQSNAKYGDGIACNSILKRDLLLARGLTFNTQISNGEDVLFMYELNRYPYKKHEYSGLVYFYRRRSGSATTSLKKSALINRINSGFTGAMIMRDYYAKQKDGEPNNNDINITAILLMHFLRHAMYCIARLPSKDRRDYIKLFKTNNLYPYRIPRECTTKSSGMTERKDFIGKLYDLICLHSSSRIGFNALCLWNILRNRT